MLGTKTESHVRQFVSKNRRRLNIDGICKEFEARKEKSGNFVDGSNGTKNDKQSDNNVIMEVKMMIKDSFLFFFLFIKLKRSENKIFEIKNWI